MSNKYLRATDPWEAGIDPSDASEPRLFCPLCEKPLVETKQDEEAGTVLHLFHCRTKGCTLVDKKRRTNHSALGIMAVYRQPGNDPRMRLIVRLPKELNKDALVLDAPVESWAK